MLLGLLPSPAPVFPWVVLTFGGAAGPAAPASCSCPCLPFGGAALWCELLDLLSSPAAVLPCLHSLCPVLLLAPVLPAWNVLVGKDRLGGAARRQFPGADRLALPSQAPLHAPLPTP